MISSTIPVGVEVRAPKEKPGTEDATVEHLSVVSSIQVSDDADSLAKAWQKLDLIVLPWVIVMYLMAILDMANVGNARIAGLQDSLHMSDTELSIALTVSVISAVLIQFPANYLLMLVGPRLLLSASMMLMSITLICHGLATSYGAFVACRVVMGMFSGALTSGTVVFMSCFYPRQMLQTRLSAMTCTVAVAVAFSGLLAAAIIGMDGIGGRPGWAWLFILEGCTSFLIGFISLFLIPNSPTEARCMTESEKQLIVDALHIDGLSLEPNSRENFLMELRSMFTQPHVILMATAGFFFDVTLSGLSLFLPSIVVGLGYEGSQAQLMSVPPFAIGAIVCMPISIISDRYAVRGLTLCIQAIISIIGYAVYIVSENAHVRYAGLLIAAPCIFGVGTAVMTWISNNTAPSARRTNAISFASMTMQLGGFLSLWLFGPLSPGPRYTAATMVLLAFQVGILLCAIATMVYIAAENRRKARLRAEYASAQGTGGAVLAPPEDRNTMANDSIWFKYVM
ncbi:MFS general substrate transporter [Fomes fomentarius]|nr:MFS general substrate transporter [Fomes fomentarius]